MYQLYEVEVPLAEVTSGMVAVDPIYTTDSAGGSVIAVPANTEFTAKTIERLNALGIKSVKVFSYKQGLAAPTPEPEPEPEPEPQAVPPVESQLGEALREETIEGVRHLFTAFKDGEQSGNMSTAYQAVKGLENLVDQLLDALKSTEMIHVSDLKTYDEYTYHHSLSVAVLSIAIGQELGLEHEQLKRLAWCAIMHDIGKLTVPLEIINKPGRLTPEEFDIIKSHSSAGGDYLKNLNVVDEDICLGVIHHHEKMDGTGYPDGLKGEEVPLFSRVISVADVYDAVTSYRSYRSPMPPSEAIELVMSDASRGVFDFKIVQAFIDKLELFPINMVVELSNGRQGVIHKNTNAMRPTLRMLDDGALLDLAAMNNLNLTVVKVID